MKVKTIPEQRLAERLNINHSTLRLWRRKFLKIGRPMDPAKVGVSIAFNHRDVFKIALAVELLRHGATQADVIDQLLQIGLKPTGKDDFLYREILLDPAGPRLSLSKWQLSGDVPRVRWNRASSVLVVNLKMLRENVDKIVRS